MQFCRLGEYVERGRRGHVAFRCNEFGGSEWWLVCVAVVIGGDRLVGDCESGLNKGIFGIMCLPSVLCFDDLD